MDFRAFFPDETFKVIFYKSPGKLPCPIGSEVYENY
jgi:hypothetical protein